METILKKITPNRPDISWYIKWISSILIMIGLTMRSANIGIPLDLFLTSLGCIGWTVVGCLWHDRSLIILNALAGAVTLIGFLNAIKGGL